MTVMDGQSQKISGGGLAQGPTYEPQTNRYSSY